MKGGKKSPPRENSHPGSLVGLEKGVLVTPREGFHMITFDNNGDSTTLALGGEDDDYNKLKSIEKWNPETETWSEVEEQLEEKKSFFGLVAVPKNLVCP